MLTFEEAKARFDFFRPYLVGNDWKEAYTIAINSIEKQIAKKPVIITDICEELPFVLLCPNCNAELEAYEHHCTCGQALDWSETND